MFVTALNFFHTHIGFAVFKVHDDAAPASLDDSFNEDASRKAVMATPLRKRYVCASAFFV